MAHLLIETLRAFDPAALARIVRQSQRDPNFEILDWTVRPLGPEILIETTGGLYCFSGSGKSGNQVQSWSIVMKCLLNLKEEMYHQINSFAYWRREAEVFQSGIMDQLPAGFRIPRFLGITEHDRDLWVWMEHIHESTNGLWSLDQYYKAAHRLGRFGGIHLKDSPLPEVNWLCSNLYREVYSPESEVIYPVDPEAENSLWKMPIMQRSFDSESRSKVLRVYSELTMLLNANDHLPQVLCHNDAHRRNLMWTTSQETGLEELVAIDLAFIGPGAIGNDLGEAVATSLHFFEYDLNDAETLEKTMFQGYLEGLTEAGWSGDPRIARLGYLISAILRKGLLIPLYNIPSTLPPELGINIEAIYHHSTEEVLAGWMQLVDFLLDRAVEVRSLIKHLAL